MLFIIAGIITSAGLMAYYVNILFDFSETEYYTSKKAFTRDLIPFMRWYDGFKHKFNKLQ